MMLGLISVSNIKGKDFLSVEHFLKLNPTGAFTSMSGYVGPYCVLYSVCTYGVRSTYMYVLYIGNKRSNTREHYVLRAIST